MTVATMQAPSSRLIMVDALRGYALMGLFLVHMTGYFELYNARPDPSWVQETTRFLFQGKSFSLMALCFGFSFFIMMDSARQRGESFALRFAWRLVVLGVIGWLHALVYRGEIIVVLAVTGLFLIPFDYIKSSRVLAGIAIFLLLQPFVVVRIIAGYEHAHWAWAEPLFYRDGGAMRPSLWGSFGQVVQANIVAGKVSKWSYFIETGRIFQVFGLFLMGLAAGRSGFFLNPARFAKLRWASLAIALLSLYPLIYWRDHTCCHRIGPVFFTNVIVSGWIDLAGTAICFFSFVQLWLWGSGRILDRFVPVGRMTLTLYVGQSLVFVPIFYGFGLHLWDRITQEESLALGVFAFIVQLAFATIWFRYFAYGPLEWIWRVATKLSLDVPFRKRARVMAATATR
ncbi:DUF418 domain-containing protein [Sphingomonas sp. MMS24-J13]|uniref:DUF418 domain-containing protein n=1 Tax=Sphingomonas sp. MMS24-J13 TaxID=3238686 RepID=UPI00384DC5D5